MHVAIYFCKLNVLWDELDRHEPLISCKCGKCTCHVGKQHEKRRSDDRLHQFFLGFCSDNYAELRSTLLSQDPLPSLNQAFQQISQDERVCGITRIHEEKLDVVGFVVRTDNPSKPRVDKATLTCSHCHKTGHDKATCFDIHGTLDWYLEKFGSTTEGKSNFKGKSHAPSHKSLVGYGNNGVCTNAAAPTATPSAPFAALPGFTAKQWAALTAAFGSSSSSSNRLNASLCPVDLPDGQTAVATKEGVVRLTDSIILHNVLFVPKLQCNLISVFQLNDDLHCLVQFNSNLCAI
ncbi:uncharacterized protein LOC133789197 [Humulus lupulus]|uniref:uncharacterized protein LOC133789197 n=1 Tax=Humulus lupulus TaxID=3486 RepID=UPI002B402DB3|nr:uncharacterized protein LOC133789197 [Humulus lupulus]